MIDSDILSDFQKETNGILADLEKILEELEESDQDFPANKLADFAQKIDRVMGAAQTLAQLDPSNTALTKIGSIALVCKNMGYKAIEYHVTDLVPLFAAFWGDAIEAIGRLVSSMHDTGAVSSITSGYMGVVEGRLKWLADRVVKVAKVDSGDPQAQWQIDQLMKSLGK